jgi:hypothetical protein
MSKYTIELRKVCDLYGRSEVESWFKDYNLSYYLRPDEIESIENAGIWSKDRLATKIVDHYYMRELGLETPALFKHYAKVYMQEIMERKLPLIYSTSIKYDPLVNVDYSEVYDRNIETSGNSSNNASGLSVSSDTPQGQIDKSKVLAGAYASATGASETETTSQDNNQTNENYVKKVKGNSGVSATAQKMILQYRENIIAIDEQIIEELDKLFMGLY